MFNCFSLFSSDGKGFVFSSLHDFTLAGSFVVYPAQVQDAVYDDSV